MNRVINANKAIYILLLAISLFGIIFFSSSNNPLGFAVLNEDSGNGDFNNENLIIDKYVPSQNATMIDALFALMRAEKERNNMISYNLSTFIVNDTLLLAKHHFIGNDLTSIKSMINKTNYTQLDRYLAHLYELGKNTAYYDTKRLNYSEVLRLSLEITSTRKQAFRIYDSIYLTEQKEKSYREQKIDTLEAIHLISEAKTSFNEERYDEAETYLKEADAAMEDAKKELFRVNELILLSKTFVVRYWWEIILILIFLGVMTKPIIRKIQIYKARKKLDSLKQELDIIVRLIKSAQEECFRDKKIPESIYEVRVTRYKERMREIKHTIPVLEGVITRGKKEKNEQK